MTLRLLLLFLLLPFLVRAAEVDDLFAAANQAYSSGQYEQAAQLYQQIIDQNGYTPSLCLNLGNAELKAGHLGLALVSYERARYLAPADTGINHNLQLARKQAGLEPNSYRWWQIMLRSLNEDVWIALVDGWLALLALAILAHAFTPSLSSFIPREKLRWMIKGVFFVSIPAFLFSGYIALLANAITQRVEGVVLVKDAELKLSPFDNADKLGTIAEGELVTVDQKHHDYVLIHARDERFGWLPTKDVAPVVPGSF